MAGPNLYQTPLPHTPSHLSDIAGIGQITGVVNTIANQINLNNERERSQREQDAGLLSKGLIRDTDPNSPTYNQVKRDPNAQAAYDQDLAEKDPTSPQSGFLRQYYKSLVRQTNPELADSISDDMSGYQLKTYEKQFGGLLGKQSQGLIARERLGLQKGNQAARVADIFDKDRIITNLTERQQQIQRDKHTLDTADVLTPQIFNEIQIGVANAISGGRSAAVSTQNKVEFNSLETEWQNLKQRLTNSPQDIGSPEVKKYMSDLLNRLNDAYQNNMASRAEQLTKGRVGAYKNNPEAAAALQEKAASYTPAKGLIKEGGGTEFEPDVINYAKTHGISNEEAAAIKKQRTGQ